MKTSIYTFLTAKCLEEYIFGLASVFMDKKNQATYIAMVDALGSDTIYDEEVLERLYSDIRTLSRIEKKTGKLKVYPIRRRKWESYQGNRT